MVSARAAGSLLDRLRDGCPRWTCSSRGLTKAIAPKRRRSSQPQSKSESVPESEPDRALESRAMGRDGPLVARHFQRPSALLVELADRVGEGPQTQAKKRVSSERKRIPEAAFARQGGSCRRERELSPFRAGLHVAGVWPLLRSIESLCRTQRPSVERLGVLGRAPADTGYSRAETEASPERRGLSESALAEGSKAADDANTDRDRCCRGGREFPRATGSPRRSVPPLSGWEDRRPSPPSTLSRSEIL